MTARDATTAFAAALVDEWVRSGVRNAVVSPGSRNAPLLLALARERRLDVDVVLDERSAGFRALGIARAAARPVVVCCTSGSAAANLHPAVVEAHHARVPLLVCTADRPPELRDTGAGQTIDQTNLYGPAVRWFVDPGPPVDIPDAGSMWRGLACRAVAAAVGPPAGPVHLNLPFREPLLPTGSQLVLAPGRADGAPWTTSTAAPIGGADDFAERFSSLVRRHVRGLLVIGWGANVTAATVDAFAAASGWPVLADAISGHRRGPNAISTYEALLRTASFAASHVPDIVVRLGAPLTSKVANGFLDGAIHQVIVDPEGAWLDPSHAANDILVTDADQLLSAASTVIGAPRDRDGAWAEAWGDAERRARGAIDAVLDRADALFDGRIARDVAAGLGDGGALVVASSLPVRALEWCMAPRDGVEIYANRGTNGIDGFVSTALGVAATGRDVVALCGDLCFLHDTNGLLGAHRRGGPVDVNATFVVVDNRGGGIFSFLPPHDLDEFEWLFATPQSVDVVEVASAHGVEAERVDDLDTLKGNLVTEGVRVLVVPVDREQSVARHRELWDAVAASLQR